MEYWKKRSLIILAIALTSFNASAHAAKVWKMRVLMGTLLQIEVEAENSKIAEEAIESGFKEVRRLDEMLSNYKANSEISRINREASAKKIEISGDVTSFISNALELGRITDGAFDITVEPLTALWKLRERKLEKMPADLEIKKALEKVNYQNAALSTTERTIHFKTAGMGIDTGGIGKGYALDQALKTMLAVPLLSATLNFGGEILYWNQTPQMKKVSIKNPLEPDQTIGEFSILASSRSTALSTSGNYERFISLTETIGKPPIKLGHILDPKKGMPVENEILSVTIIAQSAAEADAFSTAFFVMGTEKGKKFIESQKLEAVILYEPKKGEIRYYLSENILDYVRHY